MKGWPDISCPGWCRFQAGYPESQQISIKPPILKSHSQIVPVFTTITIRLIILEVYYSYFQQLHRRMSHERIPNLYLFIFFIHSGFPTCDGIQAVNKIISLLSVISDVSLEMCFMDSLDILFKKENNDDIIIVFTSWIFDGELCLA